MLLAVDIGNTNIKFGVFDGEDIVARFSVPTSSPVSELVSSFTGPIDSAIVCSVVPDVTDRLVGVLRRKIGKPPFIIMNDLDFGLDIKYEPLGSLGTDRIVNCFAAVEKHGAPVVVCSFGTATTIDVVSEKRELLGGLIAPGMRTAARALGQSTSNLPEVEIGIPETPMGRTTETSIQAGLFFSQIGLLEIAIGQIRNEIGDAAKVIATGGFAAMIAERTEKIDVVDAELTLDGLRMLHERLTG